MILNILERKQNTLFKHYLRLADIYEVGELKGTNTPLDSKVLQHALKAYSDSLIT